MSQGKAVSHSNSSTFPTGDGKKKPGHTKLDNLISLDALSAQGDAGKNL